VNVPGSPGPAIAEPGAAEPSGVGAGLNVAALTEQVVDTPRVVIDRAIVARNIRRMAQSAAAAGVSLRPHTKTHKMPEIARLQLAAGSPGIQVAKLGEAQVMADAGIADILVGYPIVGAEKLARLGALAERATISISLDSYEAAVGVAEAARRAGAQIRLLVEVDTGLRRVGVEPAAALDLAVRIAALPGLEFVGFLTHEGHVYTAAQNPGEMERLTVEACRVVVELAASARDLGLPAGVVSVGASGTARFDFGVPGVTEVRPGTYVFNDLTQIELGAATEADVAACVIATIVSRPARDRAILDAGTKTLTSDQRIVASSQKSFGRVLGEPDTWLVRASEEHGVLGLREESKLRVGDRVAIVPNHICPVINLHDDVLVAEGDALVDTWRVAARGRVR
jgi:D-serine deaminase-like pyridoxal phosphate-dependent protein